MTDRLLDFNYTPLLLALVRHVITNAISPRLNNACNETGLWSECALDTITNFPFVTVEKGQAFHAPCTKGQPRSFRNLKAVKDHINTDFYMNSAISWYFCPMICAYICVGIMAMNEGSC